MAGRGGNERPGRYSGTAELNSVIRSAAPDETYRWFFPVNPITSSNDHGCSSGLSYERQDRDRKEREKRIQAEREEKGVKKYSIHERVEGRKPKREGKWLP